MRFKSVSNIAFGLASMLTASANISASETGSALATVTQLYRDFAWEVVFDGTDEDTHFLALPDNVWQRYLSADLVKRLRQDLDCSERTQEICGLDFDPLWASQDPGAERLQVAQGGKPDQVNVSFFYPGSNARTELQFSLIEENGTWLIDDIHYPENISLRQALYKPN